MVIGIIGGGASGMAAAIAASRNSKAQVVLLERQTRVGRKLQATGNGRCNLSNRNMDESHYHGDDPGFARYALAKMDVSGTLDWFRSMGLYTVSEPSGRIYPYSDQANSVVDVLRFSLDRENIAVKTGFEVSRIRKTESGFRVEGAEETVLCDRLIVACGGLAGTKLGGSMSGYKLLKSMGHNVTRLRPALVQLKSGWGSLPALKGVRARCKVQILHDGAVTVESVGELQFTEYGLSGPVMFEVSRDVCQGKGNWQCKLDFLPEMTEQELTERLRDRRETALPAEELLTGILHNRLGRVLVQCTGIRGNTPISRLRDDELGSLCRSVKEFYVALTETLGMDSAQVTAGGVVTAEFDPQTMESKLVPGLYACGEVLDVDGDCGGYNLQWAWSSGYLAGTAAGGNGL